MKPLGASPPPTMRLRVIWTLPHVSAEPADWNGGAEGFNWTATEFGLLEGGGNDDDDGDDGNEGGGLLKLLTGGTAATEFGLFDGGKDDDGNDENGGGLLLTLLSGDGGTWF